MSSRDVAEILLAFTGDAPNDSLVKEDLCITLQREDGETTFNLTDLIGLARIGARQLTRYEVEVEGVLGRSISMASYDLGCCTDNILHGQIKDDERYAIGERFTCRHCLRVFRLMPGGIIRQEVLDKKRNLWYT